MDENKEKLHFIIYTLTKGNKNKWVRREVILALIYYFSQQNILNYFCTPTPSIWKDKIKFINISYEAITDLNYLLDNEYIAEILLSVRGLSIFIVGYSIKKYIDYSFPEEEQRKIREVIEDKEIIITDNGIIIDNLEIDLTNLKKVKYTAKPYIIRTLNFL